MKSLFEVHFEKTSGRLASVLLLANSVNEAAMFSNHCHAIYEIELVAGPSDAARRAAELRENGFPVMEAEPK